MCHRTQAVYQLDKFHISYTKKFYLMHFSHTRVYPSFQSVPNKIFLRFQGEIDALEEEIMADMENWEELSQQLEELES